MIEIKAKLNYLNITPRKIRLVANLIKTLPVLEARAQLAHMRKRAARPILKLLNSAASNAKNNFSLNEENLFVKSIIVDQGPSRKSYLPRAQGRITPILKRTSHVVIALAGLKKPLAKKSTSSAQPKTAASRSLESKAGQEIQKSGEKQAPKFKAKEIKKPLSQRLKEGFKSRIFRRKSI